VNPHGRKNIIGERVYQARNASLPPCTQQELSDRLARVSVTVSRSGVAKIESGERSVYDFEVRAFAEVLGVSVDWLLGV